MINNAINVVEGLSGLLLVMRAANKNNNDIDKYIIIWAINESFLNTNRNKTELAKE